MADKKTTKKVTKKPTPKKLNAAKKLEALENLVMGLQQQVNILAEEIDNVGQVVQLLGRRLSASNHVANIPNDAVDQAIVSENIKQLENSVNDLITKGIIKKSETGDIADDQHFVVAREIDKDGNEISPRIQFAVMTLMPDLIPKFVGQKKGAIVKNEHNENAIEITEVYSVIPPDKDINFEENTDAGVDKPTA